MRKIIQVFSLLFISILLSACISIPIGDQVLEISTDGINFTDKESDGTTEDGIVDESDVEGELNEEEQSEEMETDTELAEASAGNTNCPDYDNSILTDEVETGFYLPDCSELTGFAKSEDRIDATIEVKNGDSRDIFEAYKEYFGDRVNSENQDISNQRYEIRADESYIFLLVSQREELAVVNMNFYFD